MNTVYKLIRLYAKQLKIPSFADYPNCFGKELTPSDSRIYFWNL